MAAARLAQQLVERGRGDDVTLYGAEPHRPYNRTLLADVLTGRLDAAAVGLPCGAPQTAVRTGCEVVAVDVRSRTLTPAGGEESGYDELVLATGANPVLPPVRGLRTADGGLKAGVHAFRSLADCARLAEDATRATRAVVIGGGVLGVSAARALAAVGLPTEIVHQGPYLIERHLDEGAGDALRGALEELGVHTYPGNRARALDGDPRVTGVRLATGYLLDADLVVLACGARPRTGLARAAGIAVRNGVVVDDRLAASAPHVFAIGDCAEHAGITYGLAGPAWDQADVLAARLCGTAPKTVYRGSRPLVRLTAGPLEYAAFGETGETDGTDVLRIADATRGPYGSYKKLVLRGDRLVGGILLGDLATVGDLTHAYERDEALPGDPLHLLTTEGAA
ncbi:nitrite reductase [Streptomyces malaysiense]|uniref:Nitrite reductase n=2 Tax=Streptomyces malaysiense TaxID=1428626 RepID=A0A1J4PWJ3_9ACTN|nr:nitrite reductase [Streptomyces malaysiense]